MVSYVEEWDYVYIGFNRVAYIKILNMKTLLIQQAAMADGASCVKKEGDFVDTLMRSNRYE